MTGAGCINTITLNYIYVISFSYIPKANYNLNEYSTLTTHTSFNNRLNTFCQVIPVPWLVTMDTPTRSIHLTHLKIISGMYKALNYSYLN